MSSPVRIEEATTPRTQLPQTAGPSVVPHRTIQAPPPPPPTNPWLKRPTPALALLSPLDQSLIPQTVRVPFAEVRGPARLTLPSTSRGLF
jgi:hypothetical protein